MLSSTNDCVVVSSSSNYHQHPKRTTPLDRRSLLLLLLHILSSTTLLPAVLLVATPNIAHADFAPGGTLLDRTVSVTYGNPDASPSRLRDNSNVLFDKDNYYKFGAAAPWIDPPGSTDFPKTMPFVPAQQRYVALKKYAARVEAVKQEIVRIGSPTSTTAAVTDIPDKTDPIYQLRALGLLANSFMATENTGTTNELMLARWYINEMYLRIGDYREALQEEDTGLAKTCYECLCKAMNSYLSLLNRSISSKVGDPFGYILCSNYVLPS